MTHCVIYGHRNATILERNNTTYRLSCVLVTIIALYNTSNIASFSTDCKNDHVRHFVSNIKDGGGKP